MKRLLLSLKVLLRAKKGFSLIELSVVITIAASAAIGFLAWTQPPISTNALKSIETRSKMLEIQKAIDSFRAQKKRLPCPADPLMRNDSTRAAVGTDYLTPTGTSHDYYVNDFGMEDIDTVQTILNGVTTLGVDCPVSVGAVPIFSLGLDEAYMNDAWGRRFTYHVANTICGADSGTAIVSSTDSTAIGCTEKDYQNNTGNITVTNGAGGNITTVAAYVLVSHGANGAGAFLPSGQKLTDSANANELENSNGNTTYVKADQSTTFDDIVVFETKNQIENVVNRKTIRNISVADCEANSQALKNTNLTESGYMQSQLALTNYQQNGSNIGDQALIGVMTETQNICISYYGSSAATIGGQAWSGAQCPGTANVANGSTYYAATNTCTCTSGLWNGSCTFDWNSIIPTSGKIVWLDASVKTSFYTDVSCSLGQPLAEGTGIGCWQDQSGKGHYAFGTSTNTPTIKYTGLNNLPTVYFGTTPNKYFLAILGADSLTTNKFSTFIVYSAQGSSWSAGANGGTADTLMWIGGAATNLTNAKILIQPGTAFLQRDGNNVVNTTLKFNIPTLFDIVSDGVTTTARSSKYTTVSSNNEPYYNTAAYTAAALIIGDNNDNGTNSFFTGSISEIILYNRNVTDNERTTIETYLTTKWGL